MIKRKLHLILAIFSLAVFFTVSFLSIGCNFLGFKDTEGQYMEEVEQLQKEAQQAEEEKQTEVEQAAPAEETETPQEVVEARSFPNEPVTYTGNLSGLPVTLIVDFKTSEITGSMPSAAKVFPDTVVTDGTIYLDTLEIYVFFTGVSEMDSDGNVIKTAWLTITGKVSDDLSTLTGEILNEEGETGEITLTK